MNKTGEKFFMSSNLEKSNTPNKKEDFFADPAVRVRIVEAPQMTPGKKGTKSRQLVDYSALTN